MIDTIQGEWGTSPWEIPGGTLQRETNRKPTKYFPLL